MLPVHGVFQTWIMEWVAISFSRGSSQPRDWTWVSYMVRQILYWATWEAPWHGQEGIISWQKGQSKWTLNGCHFNRWRSVRGAWVEVLAEMPSNAIHSSWIKKGTGARLPRGGGASAGRGGELLEETGCAETKMGGGESVLYLGNS